MYEGGTKVPSFLHHGGGGLGPGRYGGMLHAVDILPTLLDMATSSKVQGETELDTRNIDGVSHWAALVARDLKQQQEPPREFMVYNIDDELVSTIFNVRNRTSKFQVGRAASRKYLNYLLLPVQMCVRYRGYKLVWGLATVLHRTYRRKDAGRPLVLELYDLYRDPGETINIADQMP